jgi:hypothetical protein
MPLRFFFCLNHTYFCADLGRHVRSTRAVEAIWAEWWRGMSDFHLLSFGVVRTAETCRAAKPQGCLIECFAALVFPLASDVVGVRFVCLSETR